MVQDVFRLEGKTTLITGAAGMLGIEHCGALLELGSTVILTDINLTELEKASEVLKQEFDESLIMTSIMDVSDPKSINKLHERLVQDNLQVDILVNNAAIDAKVKNSPGQEFSRLENFSIEQWNKELSVGLTGAFNCCQVFGGAMAKQGEGVILNIASDLSVFSPDQRIYQKKGIPDHLQPVKPITYSVIKSGLVGLTKYVATYWAASGVRCNALSPGGVFDGQDKEFVEKLIDRIPLNRMAEKNEYKAAVQFLCSDASKYMNGQNLVIDGGRSTW